MIDSCMIDVLIICSAIRIVLQDSDQSVNVFLVLFYIVIVCSV